MTTHDGYILSLQKISSRKDEECKDGIPVLLQHGLMAEGTTWFLLPPEINLPFNLVENGYQVWIVSSRGTQHSFDHKSLTPADSAYWDWTWQELALYDLPATLQYVRNQTGESPHYVGHSLGTTIALAGFTKYQLTTLLRSAVLLCPVAYMGHAGPVSRAAADIFMAEASKFLGFAEFNPKMSSGAVGELLKQLCVLPEICQDLLTGISGTNCCILSSTIGDLLLYELQSSSTKNYIHMSQMVRSGEMKMFDYEDGLVNLMHYGISTAPVFDLRSIPKDFPLFIGYGGADQLAVSTDVLLLLQDLSKHQRDKLVVQYHENYAHFDYILGERTKHEVYDHIIDFFKKN